MIKGRYCCLNRHKTVNYYLEIIKLFFVQTLGMFPKYKHVLFIKIAGVSCSTSLRYKWCFHFLIVNSYPVGLFEPNVLFNIIGTVFEITKSIKKRIGMKFDNIKYEIET